MLNNQIAKLGESVQINLFLSSYTHCTNSLLCALLRMQDYIIFSLQTFKITWIGDLENCQCPSEPWRHSCQFCLLCLLKNISNLLPQVLCVWQSTCSFQFFSDIWWEFIRGVWISDNLVWIILIFPVVFNILMIKICILIIML